MVKGKKSFEWLPAQMPGVARLIDDKRRELGREHLALCWRRGVLELQPGWFYAREGALAVGMPDEGMDADLARLVKEVPNGLAKPVLWLRKVEAAGHGA